MSLFSNLTLSFKQISSTILSSAQAFAKFTPSNSYYYVSDNGLNKIFILNESWSFVPSKAFSIPAYLTAIGSSLYATGDVNIWKLDQNLSILIQYNAIGTSPFYRGIYFNSINNFIYVAFLFFFIFFLLILFSNSFSPFCCFYSLRNLF
jgi:DNA-binding beta-propeller fold protein YncE